MSFLSEIPLIGGVLSYAVPFLILLGVVVFVHEYGHYIVGRWCGIKAEIFSVGFGKRLLGWTDKRGTQWQIALLPLGGYVKFVGDMDVASARQADEQLSSEDRAVAFHNASVRARALTVVAGPMANFLLSIVLLAGVALWSGLPSDRPVVGSVAGEVADGSDFRPGDRVVSFNGAPVTGWAQILETLDELSGQIAPIEVERDGQRLRFDINQARVDRFSNGSPAEAAGLETGDLIVDIAGTPIESFRDLQLAMAALPLETEISVAVLRDGTRQEVQFVPDVVTRQHPETGVRVGQATMGISSIGFVGIAPELEAVGPVAALSHGVATTWGIVTTTMTFLSDMLFKGADTSALGGPIGIAQVSAEQAKEGVTNFIQLIAFLSTSIGLLNLFPIPVLDGGHLVFYAAETVRGKPLGERWTNAAMAFGLSLVLLLMVFATYNDLTRL